MQIKKAVRALSMICLCAGLPCVCLGQDKVVAVVNNEIITQKDLDGFISFMRVQLARDQSQDRVEQQIDTMKQDLLQRLVEDRLILQEAKKNNVIVDKNRIKAKIIELKRAHSSEAEFQEFLLMQGVTESDLEQKMRDQMMTYEIIESQIKNKIVVKPSEITEFYEANPAQFSVPEQREFVSIVIEDEERARKVSQDLKAGKVVEAAAVEHSVKPNTFTAKKGGELKAEIENVVFALHLNGVSDAVKIDNAYYVFKLLRIIPGYKQELIEAQNAINRMLLDKKMQERMVEWLDQLKKKAYIKIMEAHEEIPAQ
ncbi:MAG: SurA N-terminal domain-containing protein [Candidatus Omnitrophica bacterium]|nr:SurA N-terminal domain-containing protein [Candidatus Omnitrophota bacterium]MDD5775169.1 SurA N-terminal domain-containing protein [Candidatus Omnitrophota bacterium]